MEKRWTRKKRARREAGGPEPKPALTGNVRMVAPDPAAEPEIRDEGRTLRPVHLRRVLGPVAVEAEANPMGETPADAGTPAAPEIPTTERLEPATADMPTAEIAGPGAVEAPGIETVEPDQPVSDPEPESGTPEDTAAKQEPAAPLVLTSALAGAPTPPEANDPDENWRRLGKFAIDARKLERNRVITATREDPVHAGFDVLRTKLLRALKDNGWTRVAVTSPTEGCGKTFMAANLALSLSRQSNCRTVILDLDMRHPSLGSVMDIQDPPAIGDFLRGRLLAQDVLRRPARNPHKIGENVAFGVSAQREDYAAELLQDPVTAEVLNEMERELAPDVVLFDMPPALVNDDVLAARPLYDGIILVVGGGMTKPQQVRDVERRLGTDTPLLGVVLNKSEDDNTQVYGY